MSGNTEIKAFVQWELVVSLYVLFSNWYLRNQSRISCVWPDEGYMNSKELILEFIRIGGYNQVPRLVIHKRMVVRILFVIRYFLGRFPIVGKTKTSGFDQFAIHSQRHTRSLFAFLKYEFLGRINHILHGWVLPLKISDRFLGKIEKKILKR
ncbi:MAG: hypothetical protein V1698_01785 [bacterium]